MRDRKTSPPDARFGPIDRAEWRLLAQLPPGRRVRVMLEARELAVVGGCVAVTPTYPPLI